MKKWMKRLLIMGAVSGGLGLGMIAAGTFMGGSARVEKTIVFGEKALDLTEEWLDERETLIDRNEALTESKETLTDGNEALTESEETLTDGNEAWEKGSLFEDIRSMEIESVGMTQIVESPDLMAGQVRVMQRGEGSEYRIFKEDGSLNVLLPSHWDQKNWNHHLAKREVMIYIPESYEFEEIEIEQVAGSVQAEQIFAQELSLKVVSGSMKIGGGQTGELETECISGSLLCLAAARESASAENISGVSTIALEGSPDDFDYEISRGSGRILLNGGEEASYGEHWGEKIIDNGTGRQVNLDCVAGKIVVEYTDFMDLEIPVEEKNEFV